MELHLATVIEEIAEVAGEQPVVVQDAHVTSWREFEDRASRLASVLWDSGLRPHSKVGLYLTNSPEYLETWLAALKIRCIPVNINYRYVEDELAYLLDDAGCEAIVFPTGLSDRVGAVLPGRDIACVLQVAGESDALIDGARRYEDAVTSADPLEPMERSEDDHFLLYTGGTTGLPKGVIYQMGGLTRELGAMIGAFVGGGAVTGGEDIVATAQRANEADASLTGLILPPLMHGTGTSLAIMTLLTGGTVILTGETFDPAVALRTLETNRASVIALVGDAFMRPLLVELDRRVSAGDPVDLSSVQLVMSSGAMLSSESKQAFLTHAPQCLVIDTLAASEAAMGSSITTAGGGPRTAAFELRPGTRVLDEADADIEPGSGKTGRVAVPSDNPIGYYNDPAKTAETFREIDGERYSLPGDWATVEADGTIRLLGRGSQCINTGGEKVFPEEVEEALKTHPAVMDALVFGVDDEKWGQRIEAVVSLRNEMVATEPDLKSHVRLRLADYKAPKGILRVATVPRSPNGKADYRAARALVSDSAVTPE